MRLHGEVGINEYTEISDRMMTRGKRSMFQFAAVQRGTGVDAEPVVHHVEL
jgi:hypothetical protein